MIGLCSGFPNDWPEDRRERFVAAIDLHWPSVRLRADHFAGDLDRARLSVPAVAVADVGDGDILAWLDPDIEVVSAVPSFVIPHLIKDADLCFIGNESGEPDLAFWAVRVAARTRDFLAALANAPADAGDASAVWGAERDKAGITARDLTPGGYGNSWGHGPLGRYTRRMERQS